MLRTLCLQVSFIADYVLSAFSITGNSEKKTRIGARSYRRRCADVRRCVFYMDPSRIFIGRRIY